MQKLVAASLIGVMVSGCSVGMAASKRGVEANRIRKCHTRMCFVSLPDTEIIETKIEEDGTEIVVFRSAKQKGSAARAVGHAAADVLTLGLWEVVGTPIEALSNNRDFWAYLGRFDADGNLLELEFDENVAPERNAGLDPNAP